MGINYTAVYRDVLPGLCGLYYQDSGGDLTLRNGMALVIGGKDKFGNDWAIVPGNKYFSGVKRKPSYFICETKMQISCSVTALLISAFVFAIKIVQFLFFLNPKFSASIHLPAL